jgi:hypothetical protein
MAGHSIMLHGQRIAGPQMDADERGSTPAESHLRETNHMIRLQSDGASFDRLRMRDDLGGMKKAPHPELVEGRTLPIQVSRNKVNGSSRKATCAHPSRELMQGISTESPLPLWAPLWERDRVRGLASAGANECVGCMRTRNGTTCAHETEQIPSRCRARPLTLSLSRKGRGDSVETPCLKRPIGRSSAFICGSNHNRAAA